MRRPLVLVIVVPLAATFACGQLREGEVDQAPGPARPNDAAASGGGEDDASTDEDAAIADAAVDVVDAPSCDGPCPPQPLATGLVQATSVAVDARNVYFATESGNGAVFQCPKTGCVGAPLKLGSGYATSIVVQGGRVVWPDFAGGRLLACAIGGCNEEPTVLALNQTQIRYVATDGVSFFWTAGGAIVRCGVSSCSPQPVISDLSRVTGVAADQARVFFGHNQSPAVTQACSTFPCASPLLLGPGALYTTAYAGKVYWVNGASKNVVSCSMEGCAGNPQTLGSSTQPAHPVSDGQHVYWRDMFLDQIYRCPAAGCLPSPEIFATKQRAQPGGNLALDGQYVYWSTTSGVYRLRK
jgi:hypothetical protein